MRLYFLYIEEFNEFTNCKFANLQIICIFAPKLHKCNTWGRPVLTVSDIEQ